MNITSNSHSQRHFGGGRDLAPAALSYTARGWPVFPLKPREKVPLIPKRAGGNGCKDATTDPARIRPWWDACPQANIGLVAEPFWVLDVDYAGWDATQPDGATSLTALVERFGKLPPTAMQLTGGGGWQYLFAADERVRNGQKFLPGLDVRAPGGYIVAPPSIHPSGRAYRWRRGYGPGEIELAKAPEWLIALVEPVAAPLEPLPAPLDRLVTRAPVIFLGRELASGPSGRYGDRALERACDAIAAAPIGQQNDILDRQAYGIGRLVAGGAIDRGMALAALVSAGCRMANAPRRERWTHKIVAWRVDRAFGQAASSPRTGEAA